LVHRPIYLSFLFIIREKSNNPIGETPNQLVYAPNLSFFSPF